MRSEGATSIASTSFITRRPYGRIVARCFDEDGPEINRAMIEGKIAKKYMRYTNGYYLRSE